MNQELGKKLSRRAFLKVTGLGLGVVTTTGFLSGCVQPAAPAPAAPATAAPVAAPTTAPSTAPKAGGKSKITFGWTFGSAAEGAEALVKTFNEQSSTAEVEFQIVPYDSVLPKLQTSFGSGAGPDCLSITSAWSAALGAANYLEDLEPRTLSAGLDKELTPIAISTGKSFKDTLYYVSFMVDIYTLYHNKLLFKEAGITEPPVTIDDFHAVAKKLTIPDKGQYGVYMPGAAPACDRFYYTWAFGYGGLGQKAVNKSLFDENNKCIMGSPKHVEGLQKWLDLYQKDKVAPEASASGKTAEQDNGFSGGKLGMVYTWLGGITNYGKTLGAENLGTSLPPVGPAGTLACAGTNGFSMNAASKNKDAAWEFLSWMLEPEQNAALCKAWGAIPCNIKALDDPYLSDPIFAAPKQVSLMDAEQLYPPRHLAAYGKFFEQVGPELCQKAMLNQITAQEWGEGIAKYYDDAAVAEGAA